MKCSKCGGRLKAIHTDAMSESVKRQRVCQNCGNHVRTIEQSYIEAIPRRKKINLILDF